MTETPITQQEMNDVLQFFKQHRIAHLGDEGNHNGTIFGQFFDRWNVPLTKPNLELAFKKLQEGNADLIYYTADEAQYHAYVERLGPESSETIRKFLPYYRLSDVGDALWINFNAIAEYCLRTGQAITKDNLERVVIGNLRNSPAAATLRWKPAPKQDWEKQKEWERQRSDEAIAYNKEQQRINSPEYQEEQRQQELAKQKAQIGKDNNSYWEQRTRSFIASIPSHTARAEAEQLFGAIMNGNWEVNFRSVSTWWDRKKNQPGHWY